MVNLLEKLNYTTTNLIQGKEAESRREDGKENMSVNKRSSAFEAINSIPIAGRASNYAYVKYSPPLTRFSSYLTTRPIFFERGREGETFVRRCRQIGRE